MVRLTVLIMDTPGGTVEFQFHYGAINGREEAREIAIEAIFQFHYGAINGKNSIFRDGPSPISIPLWCD